MTPDDPADGTAKVRRHEAIRRPLPKRFYQAASFTIAELPPPGRFAVLLDGRRARTPRKSVLALPTAEFAAAVAGEWQAQRAIIDPATMPLTTLACTTLDAVIGREAEVSAEIVKFSGSDLLCYRAPAPAGLVRRQSEAWDPVLAWARTALRARFVVTTGMMSVTQPAEAPAAIEKAIGGLDPFSLAAMHVLTTLMGSAIVATAVLTRHLPLAEAWAAAHVDEDWQISQWGGDADAEVRRANRWRDAQAAGRVLGFMETR